MIILNWATNTTLGKCTFCCLRRIQRKTKERLLTIFDGGKRILEEAYKIKVFMFQS
jgi:hypothetical protein